MWEILAAECVVVTEAGQAYKMCYYILVEEAEASGNLLCETYGVRIDSSGEDGTQSKSLRHITFCLNKINWLVRKMVEHQVTPAGLQDVVEDWIAAG